MDYENFNLYSTIVIVALQIILVSYVIFKYINKLRKKTDVEGVVRYGVWILSGLVPLNIAIIIFARMWIFFEPYGLFIIALGGIFTTICSYLGYFLIFKTIEREERDSNKKDELLENEILGRISKRGAILLIPFALLAILIVPNDIPCKLILMVPALYSVLYYMLLNLAYQNKVRKIWNENFGGLEPRQVLPNRKSQLVHVLRDRNRAMRIENKAMFIFCIGILFSVIFLFFSPTYLISIDRDFNNSAERKAILSAENLNYKDYLPRLETYIDSKFINDHIQTVENDRTYLIPIREEFYYHGKARAMHDLMVNKTFTGVTVLNSDGEKEYSRKFQNTNGNLYLINHTNETIGQFEDQIIVGKCYLVEMDFEHDKFYASLGADYVFINQVVLLNEEYRPIMIDISYEHYSA